MSVAVTVANPIHEDESIEGTESEAERDAEVLREMAAVACFLAGYDSLRMTNHGFWQDPATMYNAYIKPYKGSFPLSHILAQLFDFLRAV